MRIALILALVACEAAAQGRVFDRACSVSSRRSSRGGVACVAASAVVSDGGADPSVAYSFVFAPPDGGGMGAACDCADITAADGSPVTVTRASVAYCTKGNYPWTAGIGSGDVVACADNKPRVMKNASGTLGYLSELEQANTVWPSEDFSHANWLLQRASSVAFPILVVSDGGDFYRAPDGTNTASQITFGACSAGVGHSSLVNAGCNGTLTPSIYIKSADSTDKTIDVFRNDYVDCVAAGDGGWRRCFRESIATAGQMQLGNQCASTGIARPTNTILIWGADCKGGPLTSYVKTTTAAATRKGDIATVPVYPPTPADLQLAFDFTTQGAAVASSALVQLQTSTGTPGTGGVNYFDANVNATKKLSCATKVALVTTLAESVATIASSSASSATCNYDGVSQLTGCLNGVCTDAGFAASVVPSQTGVLLLGANWNATVYAGQPDALLTNVVVSSTARKTIHLFGHSIVYGAKVPPDAMPQAIINRDLGRAVAVTNHGVSGKTMTGCTTDWEAVRAEVVAGGNGAGPRTYFFIDCALNSSDAGSPAVIAGLQALYRSAADAGIHVLASQVTPDIVRAGFVTEMNLAMPGVVADAGLPMAMTFPILERPADSGICDQTTPLCDPDGAHPNDAGTLLMVREWIRAGGW